ncbi:MAG: ATP synthase F1 subunit epsilon [Armatimonadetes bacterium]|nr:ATP synthase F1 subunit epsilon [Armatimonadota bacterium]MBS1701474.1 ATP synthase F1 subunit epsilon [Armatimonadota bacterium]MBS1725474.1 ATP synthase F1 subunit epsilon [Armatimonadota bacterium]
MATEFALSVVAPDREVVSTTTISVIAPGVDGYFGVQAGHVAVVSALRPGVLEYLDNSNNRHHVYVGGGFVQVGDNSVTVLADEARYAGDLDVSEAEKALEQARMELRGDGNSTMTQGEAILEIERATARLKAAKR